MAKGAMSVSLMKPNRRSAFSGGPTANVEWLIKAINANPNRFEI